MPEKRRLLRRILIIAAAVLVLLVLAAVLILPRILDVETHRGRVEALLQRATGWEAELGEMELSLFPGIALEVRPANLIAPGDGSKLEVQTIRVRAELFPLLRGKLIVHEIALLQPRIVLVRKSLKDGWELPAVAAAGTDGAAAPAATGTAAPGGTEPAATQTKAQGSGLAVSIEEVRVSGGELRFEDRAGDPPLSIALNDVEFVLQPESGEIQGEARIADGGGKTSWGGTLGQRLDLRIQKLPTDVLRPWLGQELIHPGGLLNGGAEVRWPMEVQGQLSASNLTLLSGERPLDAADLEFHLTTEGEAWRLAKLVFNADGARITGSGSLLPELALDLELPDTPLETTLQVADSVMPLPLDLSPPGNVRAKLRVDQGGAGGAVEYEAEGSLTAASFSAGEMLPPVNDIRTTFRLDRKGALEIHINEGRVADGPLTGTARMASLDPPGKLVFDGGVQHAVLGQLLGGMISDAAKRMTGPTGLSGKVGLDLSRQTLDARALTGRLELKAQEVGLPGWDLEGAMRAKIMEKLSALPGAAALLSGADKPAREPAAGGEKLLDALSARVDFDSLPWKMQDLALAAGGVSAAGDGTFDPMEGGVDMRVTSRMSAAKSRAFVERYAQAKVLLDRNGEIALPMHIKGSVFSPSISVEVGDVLQKSVEGKVEDKAKKLLKGLLDR